MFDQTDPDQPNPSINPEHAAGRTSVAAAFDEAFPEDGSYGESAEPAEPSEPQKYAAILEQISHVIETQGESPRFIIREDYYSAQDFETVHGAGAHPGAVYTALNAHRKGVFDEAQLLNSNFLDLGIVPVCGEDYLEFVASTGRELFAGSVSAFIEAVATNEPGSVMHRGAYPMPKFAYAATAEDLSDIATSLGSGEAHYLIHLRDPFVVLHLSPSLVAAPNPIGIVTAWPQNSGASVALLDRMGKECFEFARHESEAIRATEGRFVVAEWDTALPSLMVMENFSVDVPVRVILAPHANALGIIRQDRDDALSAIHWLTGPGNIPDREERVKVVAAMKAYLTAAGRDQQQ